MFEIDQRISASSIWLIDWPLSSLYLKNDADFPWVLLVPREENIQELYQLSAAKRQALVEEIVKLSTIMKDFFNPDKLNVGTLGNIVSQLHIHVVARFETDSVWPHSVWQPGLIARPYDPTELNTLIASLCKLLR